MEKLQLNDAAIQYTPTHSPALGNGLRVGFLGIFHAEIVQERLEREFDLGLIATSPSVRYEVITTGGTGIEVSSPADLPDPTLISEIREPVALVTIFTPQTYLGNVLTLCDDHRGEQADMHFYGDRVKLTYMIPLPELIVTFFDELKSVSSGFASMEYAIDSYRPVQAVKLSILINHEPVEPLSQIVVKDKAESLGRQMTKKLKEVIPKQLFEIPIQAAIGGKIIARETISAFRKDVTAKLYGGDRTRRMKLLEKQKKGKERRAKFGKVEIPQEAFMAVLKRE
jgi:GTP-binding protein LepA